jgi:hypothetical protein
MEIPSKALQETILGEGLAIGALMLGISSVTGNKSSLELDFRRAWRGWASAAHFPAVHAGPVDDSVFRILRSSSARATPHVAHWAGEWPYVPVLLVDWSLIEAAEHIDDRVPPNEWVALVDQWLKH